MHGICRPLIVTLCAVWASCAQSPPEPPFTLKQVGPNAGDALAESIVPRLKEKFGQWEFVEPVAKNNVLETDAEMSGTKRIPSMSSQ